jgi:hypothetical protein
VDRGRVKCLARIRCQARSFTNLRTREFSEFSIFVLDKGLSVAKRNTGTAFVLMVLRRTRKDPLGLWMRGEGVHSPADVGGPVGRRICRVLVGS